MTLDYCNTDFKARVNLFESLGLRVVDTDAAEKVVSEEDIIDMANPSNTNKMEILY